MTSLHQNSEIYPLKVLQFGEGNFIRGFADYMIDTANCKGIFNGSIAVVKPRKGGSLNQFKEQNCRYTVRLTGKKKGRVITDTRVVSCIRNVIHPYEEFSDFIALSRIPELRFVISNTTEAGIAFSKEPLPEHEPPDTYPGKLTQILIHRFTHFNGDHKKGLIIIPLELIEENGPRLKECVLQYCSHWNLSDDFVQWLNKSCIFASSSVDRIITGYPATTETLWEELGYEDKLIVEGELYGSWIIQSGYSIEDEFPLHKAGMPVTFTSDLAPYKQTKVRILNGAHTSFVPASYLAGNDTVAESMMDTVVREYLEETLYREILPILPSECVEPQKFTSDVIERFENPSIRHSLLDISLNSTAKWRARCLPSLLDYLDRFGQLPPHLVFSLAGLIAFYTSGEVTENTLTGMRDGKPYEIRDSKEVIDFFSQYIDAPADLIVSEYLKRKEIHGRDLSIIPGLCDSVSKHLDNIRKRGVRKTMKDLSE